MWTASKTHAVCIWSTNVIHEKSWKSKHRLHLQRGHITLKTKQKTHLPLWLLYIRKLNWTRYRPFYQEGFFLLLQRCPQIKIYESSFTDCQHMSTLQRHLTVKQTFWELFAIIYVVNILNTSTIINLTGMKTVQQHSVFWLLETESSE